MAEVFDPNAVLVPTDEGYVDPYADLPKRKFKLLHGRHAEGKFRDDTAVFTEINGKMYRGRVQQCIYKPGDIIETHRDLTKMNSPVRGGRYHQKFEEVTGKTETLDQHSSKYASWSISDLRQFCEDNGIGMDNPNKKRVIIANIEDWEEAAGPPPGDNFAVAPNDKKRESGEDEEPEEDILESMTIQELRDYADANEIVLTNRSKKDSILKEIQEFEAGNA